MDENLDGGGWGWIEIKMAMMEMSVWLDESLVLGFEV